MHTGSIQYLYLAVGRETNEENDFCELLWPLLSAARDLEVIQHNLEKRGPHQIHEACKEIRDAVSKIDDFVYSLEVEYRKKEEERHERQRTQAANP